MTIMLCFFTTLISNIFPVGLILVFSLTFFAFFAKFAYPLRYYTILIYYIRLLYITSKILVRTLTLQKSKVFIL